jgi:predicted PurR-regulated permease PerM
MDTLCRMVLLKSITNAHPLIVIFGIILGVPLLGFWGIIFGPLILSGFFLLIKIYHLTYKND